MLTEIDKEYAMFISSNTVIYISSLLFASYILYNSVVSLNRFVNSL